MESNNQKLREARQRCQWTMEQASERIGVDTRTYIRWERGKQHPGLRHMRLLCELFQTTPEELGFPI
ncbi:MAG TPA: helix-turn-helix transcriptional regulator [Ktedonobacteraceae bacterium]|nr:helix-turn-helix transcriptional regulator [Ktedonobacteraceae bacterium]